MCFFSNASISSFLASLCNISIIPLPRYSYDSLIRDFSFVFQRVYLFSDTIANNIRFGKPNATLEEVKAVAKKARCYEFIMALPEGFDTVIGEGARHSPAASTSVFPSPGPS